MLSFQYTSITLMRMCRPVYCTLSGNMDT